ncbi:MAG: cyclic nucleotide-binding domain-containing protein [Hyphomicrobiaceae bacterium]|nr:cyclic nucleotide-binding domain-containing protein [Hyphomicrobiaceae bacterium]
MSLEQDIRRLARTPLLGAVTADALRLIAFSAEPVELAPGDVLFRRGDAADCAYFIVSGAIGFHDDDQPYDDPPRHRAGSDSMIGETAMIAEVERPATARALEPTLALRIPRTIMKRVLIEFPEDAARMRARLARQLVAFGEELAHARSRSIEPGE